MKLKLKRLFNGSESDGSRAVSPVIGVILMVAITVILAAVIGTFVLGLGDSVESAPQASFNFDYDSSSKNVTLTHRGGDTINANSTELRVNGTSVDSAGTVEIDDDTGDTFANATSGTFQAGDSVGISRDASSSMAGDTIVLVTADGDRQNIIAEFEVPES